VVSSITHRDRSRSAIGPEYTNAGTLSMARKNGLARRRRKVGSMLAMSGGAPCLVWTGRGHGRNLDNAAAARRFLAAGTTPARRR
jgi:hypothetical protein